MILQHPRIPRPQPNQNLKGSSPSHCTGKCMHLWIFSPIHWCLLPHRSLVCVVFVCLFLVLFAFYFLVFCPVFLMSVAVHRTMYRFSISVLLRPLPQWPLRVSIEELPSIATSSPTCWMSWRKPWRRWAEETLCSGIRYFFGLRLSTVLSVLLSWLLFRRAGCGRNLSWAQTGSSFLCIVAVVFCKSNSALKLTPNCTVPWSTRGSAHR